MASAQAAPDGIPSSPEKKQPRSKEERKPKHTKQSSLTVRPDLATVSEQISTSTSEASKGEPIAARPAPKFADMQPEGRRRASTLSSQQPIPDLEVDKIKHKKNRGSSRRPPRSPDETALSVRTPTKPIIDSMVSSSPSNDTSNGSPSSTPKTTTSSGTSARLSSKSVAPAVIITSASKLKKDPSPRNNSAQSKIHEYTSPSSDTGNIYGNNDESLYEPNASIDLWPNRIARFDWQAALCHKIASNSKSILSAAIQIALVETTAISANRLYLLAGDHSAADKDVTILFTEMQDERTQQVLRHHAEYKSFWYKSGTIRSRIGEVELAPPSEQKLVKTLMSYVPRIVVRRFINDPYKPLRAPEVETYFACVLFADISGFTPLTASLSTLGAEGVERVTTHLNAYFSSMINLISDHGGDVVKFAGDALVVIWPTTANSGLYSMALLGCQCALALQRKMGHYVVGDTELRIHIGVGAGKVSGIHVGGVQGRREFFVAGHPMEQVGSCEAQAEPGEVFVSPECQSIIDNHFIGSKIGDNYRLDNIELPASLPHTKEFPLFDILKTRLEPYVPAAVLTHLDTHDYLGELRTISVLFVKLDTKFVNEDESPMSIQIYVAGIQTVLARFEGTMRQFIIDDKGSVLIAAFGLPPLAHEDDPIRAVDCALEIKQVLKTLNVGCSIGVTTGRAFCGAVGSESRREYAVVGDAVNLSARLMAASKEEILCDQPTYLASKGSISFDVLKPIMVKGKDHPIQIFKPLLSSQESNLGGSTVKLNVLREATVSESNTTVPVTQDNTLVGHKDIITLFSYKLEQLLLHSQSAGHVLVLEGEAGSGKSRLVERLVRMSKDSQEIFLGTADVGGSQPPFGPWSYVFDSLFDVSSEDEDETEFHERVLAEVRKISLIYPLPDLVPSWESIAPLLNLILPLLGLPESQTTRAMSEQTKYEILHILLLRLLQTSLQPGSIIILEDAHEFDYASWTLALAASQQVKGVLFVVSLRPPRPPIPFAYQQIMHCEHASYVAMKPLSSSEAILLAKQILGVTTQLPKELNNIISDKSQGNPFIIEQMILTLQENGTISVHDGTVQIRPGAALTTPTTANGLITSKIDRLSTLEKNILKVASVIGKSFDTILLKHLLPSLSSTEMNEGLVSLVKAGLITEDAASTLNDSEDPDGNDLRKSRRRMTGSSRESMGAKKLAGDMANSEDGGTSLLVKKPLSPSSPETSHSKKSINRDTRADSVHSEDESDRIQSKKRRKVQREIPNVPESTCPNPPSPIADADNSSASATPTSPRKPNPLTAAAVSPESAKRSTKKPKSVENDSAENNQSPSSPSKSASPKSTEDQSKKNARSKDDPSPSKPALSQATSNKSTAVTPRRGFDRNDSLASGRRTLKRGPSMRGTRSSTLRKMSMTSDGTPRLDSTASEEREIVEYSFKNQTIHEVVYSMMLFSQRRSLHSEIAKWYQNNFSESLSQHAAILAHHLKLSDENPSQASKFYVMAGQKALRNFANQDAVHYFTEAITLMKKLSKSAKASKPEPSKKNPAGKVSLPPLLTEPQDDIDQVSLLTTHRKLAQAYFNLGDLNSARVQLRHTLKLVKITLNSDTIKSSSINNAASLKEFGYVLSADGYTRREVILALLTMARVSYFACNSDISAFCNFTALAIAKQGSFWGELAEAYAQSIVSAGLTGQHQLVSIYIQEGAKLATDHSALQSTVDFHSGIYYVTRAAWKLSDKCFRTALKESQLVGDRRRVEEINIHWAAARILQGNFKKALVDASAGLESARLRGDVQCQIMALLTQASTHLLLRNFFKATSKLDQARIMLNRDHGHSSTAPAYTRRSSLVISQPGMHAQELSSSVSAAAAVDGTSRSGDLSSEFTYHALLASLCLAKGDTIAAHEAVKVAEDIMLDKNVQPTSFFTYPGYSGVPEVYLRLLMHPKEWKKIEMSRNKLIKRFNRSMEHFLEFSKMFVFAGPRYHLLLGLGMLACGTANMDTVIPEWKRGFDLAKQYKMTGEEQIIASHIAAETNEFSIINPESLSSEASADVQVTKPKKKKTHKRSESRQSSDDNSTETPAAAT